MTSVIPTSLPAAEAAGESVPVADYGMLADCASAALVARLLDPDAGHWSIRPRGEFTVERRYLPGTLVIETTFSTTTGSARLTDALAFAEGQRGHDIGIGAPHELLRRVEGVEGEVDMVMELAPRPEYGLVKPLFRQTEGGGRTFGGPNQVAVRAGVPVMVDRADMTAAFTVAADEEAAFSLAWAAVEDSAPVACPPELVGARLADTAEAWNSWEREHDIYEGPHRELVRFSSRVLKGLTYRPTGAIVAAATTSLPETVGGERNWDYRFSWIRDSSLTLEALYIGTCSDEAENFVSFMTSAAGGRTEHALQIMYGIGGEHDLSERELDHLRGWRDSRPVRVGNGAWNQVQLDVYGELLMTLHLYREQLGDLHPEIQQFVADLADAAARGWTERDSGIWEMRGEPL